MDSRVSNSKTARARRASQHADMRRKNESVVLSHVRRFEGLSSADIARRSGLAPQTVSVLLRGLEEQGLVMRGEVLRGRRGQPAVPILINPDGGYGLGIEIGWRHLDIVLINLNGEILAHDHLEYDYPRAETLLGMIEDGISNVTGAISQVARARLVGAGVAMPSLMSLNMFLLGASEQEAAGIHNLDICGELERRLGCPVVISNDGTSACRAECTYGKGAQYGDIVHIFISTFVGAGIYLDGRVIVGRTGDAATIGSFMVPNESGEIKALHFTASVKALEDWVAKAGKPVLRTPPDKWDWDAIAPEAEKWLAEAAEGLALAIANSCTVIDFSTAIIDGTIPRDILRRLVEQTQQNIAKLPIQTFEPPLVTIGNIGPRAPAIGAANLPLYLAYFAQESFGEKWRNGR